VKPILIGSGSAACTVPATKQSTAANP
jgi:hypothetical protein